MMRIWLLCILLLGGDLLAQSPYVAARAVSRRHRGQPYLRHLQLYGLVGTDDLFLRNRSDTLTTARYWQLYHPQGGEVRFGAAGTAQAELGQFRVQVAPLPDESGWQLASIADTLFLLLLPADSSETPAGATLVRRLRQAATVYPIPLLSLRPRSPAARRWTVEETGQLEDIPQLFRILAILITVREQYLR